MKKKYGLRRKKEIWVTQNTLRRFRQRARELIALQNPEEEKVLIDKLVKIGVVEKGAGLDTVLGLTVDDLLERRLQSIVFSKGMTKTPFQARQAIVHGQVTIDGRKVVFPSYTVAKEEEAAISCSFKPPETPARGVVKAPPTEEASEDAPTEIQEKPKEEGETKDVPKEESKETAETTTEAKEETVEETEEKEGGEKG